MYKKDVWNTMKRFAVLVYMMSTATHLAKDTGAYAYHLGKDCGYDAQFVYFGAEPIHDSAFEKHCKLEYLGNEEHFDKEIELAKSWLSRNANNLDVLMLFNYGHASYHTANYAKKVNPRIKILCKLDMSEGGFSHFYDGSLWRSIKASIEKFKSRNIDLFTVENRHFYEELSKTLTFRGRIKYLPNCVFTDNAALDQLDKIQKENCIISVSRFGAPEKNDKMLMVALAKIPVSVLHGWIVLLVGPWEQGYEQEFAAILEKYPHLKTVIKKVGSVHDRQRLYEYYAKSKIFIATSESESFNIAAIEGMYCGCYPILTKYGTIVNEITNHEECGAVVQRNHVDGLAEVLTKTMADTDLLSRCAMCRQYAREHFSYTYWTKVLDRYLKEE